MLLRNNTGHYRTNVGMVIVKMHFILLFVEGEDVSLSDKDSDKKDKKLFN